MVKSFSGIQFTGKIYPGDILHENSLLLGFFKGMRLRQFACVRAVLHCLVTARHKGVNNFPKVVTLQRTDRRSNRRSVDRELDSVGLGSVAPPCLSSYYHPAQQSVTRRDPGRHRLRGEEAYRLRSLRLRLSMRRCPHNKSVDVISSRCSRCIVRLTPAAICGGPRVYYTGTCFYGLPQ